MPKKQKPVVALDIDGTLGDYHGHFLRFAAGWLNMPGLETCPTCHALAPYWDPNNNTDGEPLHVLMGITKELYRECKLAYRQGGMKRTMPAYEHADYITRTMRMRGLEIWICTTRPYLRLDNIDPDTRHWLQRNDITYDYLVYGEDKYAQLLDNVGVENVINVVDDLPEQYDLAVKHGMWPLLRDQPYNRYRADITGIRRAEDMLSVFALVEGHHQAWKEQHA